MNGDVGYTNPFKRKRRAHSHYHCLAVADAHYGHDHYCELEYVECDDAECFGNRDPFVRWD
jgi:hypothetical protein